MPKRYSLVEIDHKSLYVHFKWIIDDLELKGCKAKKVLVFCRRKEHVKELYELFHTSLGIKSYYRPNGNETLDDRSRLFAMYHKKTHDLVKETVENEFCKADGVVRVVFCTIAFGMGINVKGADTVIHLGPSGSLEDYHQESGRIGRDSETMSHAILFKYKGCTCSRNISKPMKNYVKNVSQCRRVLLNSSFSDIPVPNSILHTCCDICAAKCKCLCKCETDVCHCDVKCIEANNVSSPVAKCIKSSSRVDNLHLVKKVKNVSTEQCKQLHDCLITYQSELVEYCQHEQLLTGIDIASGFSSSLIEQIVQNVQYIDTIEYLRDHFHFFSEEHVIKTWQFINNIILINGNQGERITKEKYPLYADKGSSDITSDGSKSTYEEESSSSQQCAARKQNTLLLYDDDSWSS
jgi:superfamily II DNA helicase RecQ